MRNVNQINFLAPFGINIAEQKPRLNPHFTYYLANLRSRLSNPTSATYWYRKVAIHPNPVRLPKIYIIWPNPTRSTSSRGVRNSGSGIMTERDESRSNHFETRPKTMMKDVTGIMGFQVMKVLGYVLGAIEGLRIRDGRGLK